MKFAAQLMQLAGSDPGSNTLLSSYEEPANCATQKNHSMHRTGTCHHDTCECIDSHSGPFSSQLCHASGHRNTLPVLPPLTQYPLGHKFLGIFNGDGADVISAKYCALHRLPAPPAGDAALLLSCIDLFAVCRQRHFCPVLFSRL